MSGKAHGAIEDRRVPSRKFPANASKTTLRKAYATAIASERRTLGQRVDSMAGRLQSRKTNKKKGTSSLKVAGMAANRPARSTYRNDVKVQKVR